MKGLNPRNQWVRIGAPVQGGEEVRLHIEAASNPVIMGHRPFAPTPLGDRETAAAHRSTPWPAWTSPSSTRPCGTW